MPDDPLLLERSLEIVYRIDEFGRLSYLNEHWDLFAEHNEAPDLIRENVLGRSLWHQISDPSTRTLYQDLIKRLPEKKSIEFDFRCDSSRLRRLLHMTISVEESSGEIEFRSTALSISERPAIMIYETNISHSDRLVRSCSWCKRVLVGQNWLEVEEAMTHSHLMEWTPPPLLSHTICEDCHGRILGAMK